MGDENNTNKPPAEQSIQYKTIIENLQEGYILVDEDANIHDVNPAYCKIIGYTKEELLSMNLTEVRPGMSLSYQKEFIEDVIQKGSKEFETKHRRKDGTMVDLKASAAAIEKEDKIYFAGFVRDVTEQKKLRQQQEKKAQEFKSLFDNNPSPVFHLNLEGSIEKVNEAFSKISGYSKSELRNMHFSQLAVPEERAEVQQHFEAVINGVSQENEVTGLPKSGAPMIFQINTFPITVKGEIVGAFGVAEDITEKREAQLKRKENRQRFESLFENNPHSVYYMDLEGNYLGLNDQMETLTGYARKELKELNFAPLIADKDLERTQKHFEKAAQGQIQTYEIDGINKQGEIKPIRVTNFPMIVGDEIEGVFGIAEDITERKEHEKKLKKSEQKWQRLVQNSPQPVQVINKNAEILLINQAGAALYGAKNPEELIGTSILSFNEPDIQENIKERVTRIRKNMPVDNYHEHVITTLDGEERIVEVYSTSVEYQGEQAVQSIYHDITNRKQAEEAIKESENLKSSILQTALDAIITIDHEGRIIEFNKAAEQMFGYTTEEVLNKEMGEVIVPPDYREDHEKGMNRYLETGNSKIMGERLNMEAVRADGTIFPIELSINKIEGTDPPKFTGFMRDITDRKRKEQKILYSLKEKKIMLQEIHHRIKNNMAVVSGLLELQAMSTEDKNLKDILKKSQMRIHSMAMIHEKLYSSKSLAEISFSDYAQELVQFIVDSIDDIDTQITVRYRMDAGKLNINQAIPCGLILNELVVNCYKHAFPEQDVGTILVGFLKEGDTVTISIEDNGKGMPDNFDIDEQQTLGMTIIKTLSSQLEGDLSIQSGKDEVGTCCTISFTEDN
jgi:PAS domain S-box-containing protein